VGRGGRVDVVLVVGGRWHDLDFARLELLRELARHDVVRTRVFEDYGGAPEALARADALLWDASDDPGLRGYEVVWRPTINPYWTHRIPVGKVTTTQVDLSKDNVIFGVRAVGRHGHRSPAVFPFPAPTS